MPFGAGHVSISTDNWRCELRAATVLRRSGWSAEMFVNGEPIKITGLPDRARRYGSVDLSR